MKSKNFDYHSIIPFDKANPNVNFNPKRCFKYYFKHTNKNKVYSLEETFKYINKHYAGYKKSDKMNASERYSNQKVLIDKLSDLDYDSQISFSVAYSVFVSLYISLYFALLQISDGSGNNFFEGLNNCFNDMKTIISQQSNITVKIIEIIFYLIISALTIGIFSLPVLSLILFIKDNYSSTIYYNKLLKPYERKVVQETLMTYNSDYNFLK